jgi:hypothetical protein
MAMKWTPVQSSQILEVGHDSDTNKLGIKFSSGATYHYANVPAHMHNAMLNAPSVGRYFGEYIKKDTQKYPFTKVD